MMHLQPEEMCVAAVFYATLNEIRNNEKREELKTDPTQFRHDELANSPTLYHAIQPAKCSRSTVWTCQITAGVTFQFRFRFINHH